MRAAARRNRREEKRTVIFVCVLTLCLVFLLGLTFGSILSKAKETTRTNGQKHYANIEIQPGDTLWSLADEYLDENYESKEAYIEEVLKINSLTSQDHIVSGQYLVMPYYAEAPI